MRQISLRMVEGIVGIVLILGFVRPSFAHEPLFGLGPHTIYQYGYALEAELEKGDQGWLNQLELLYGITPDLAVTLAIPYLFANRLRSAGPGDLVLRSKFRFYRDDQPGASNQAAFHGGVKFASGDQKEFRGNGATDYFLGISLGRESRRHYFFAGVLYRINGTVKELNRGNVWTYNLAYGIRPWKSGYLQPDAVFLWEVNGEVTGKSYVNGRLDRNTGGRIVSLAVGILFSYRNVMLKSGVQFPVIRELIGKQEEPGNEYVLGLEFHMPPLF